MTNDVKQQSAMMSGDSVNPIQFGGAAAGTQIPDASLAVRDGLLQQYLEIVNKRGLHARASAKFVGCVDQFDAKISVAKDGQTVGGDSIMGLMMLAASIGSSIEVTASGPQAHEAMSALKALVASGFGETD